jgi:hypothetical protein
MKLAMIRLQCLFRATAYAVTPVKLCHVGSNASRLILAEQLRRRPPPRLILEIDIGKRLPGAVTDFEGRTDVLDGPRRRETADAGHWLENFDGLQLL